MCAESQGSGSQIRQGSKMERGREEGRNRSVSNMRRSLDTSLMLEPENKPGVGLTDGHFPR